MASDWLRAIVVDANPADSALLRVYLNPQCQRVETAHSSKESVRLIVVSLCSNSPIDLVIMNQTLQGMDGIATTTRIRESGFDGMIVGTCSDLTMPVKEMWLAAGCNAFLEKPISVDMLTTTLTDLRAAM